MTTNFPKPVFHIGQEVVVNTANGLMMGKIEAAQTVHGIWKYGVKIPGFTQHTPMYVAPTDIVFVYTDTESWVPKVNYNYLFKKT